MSLISLIPALLDALVAIPKIGDMVTSVVSSIVLWWAGKQKLETLSLIADAAALSARAKTDPDRYAAAAAWQKALSRPKVTP